MTRRIASFPHMGDYAHVFKDLAHLLDCEPRIAPPITKRTLEIGAKHSPESVCLPFKYNLGNFIEAIEDGADVIIQAGGGCRFGYYAAVQEAICHDIGYDVDFIQLSNEVDIASIVRFMRRHNKRVSAREMKRVINLTWRKLRALDATEDIMRKNLGFEVQAGAHDEVYKTFLGALTDAPDNDAVEEIEREAREAFGAIAIDKPENPLRVAVVGELYVLMEPFSNMDVERQLAARGVEVHRFCNVTGIIDSAIAGYPHVQRMLETTEPYLEYNPGAEGAYSVYYTLKLMDEGFDGVIHVKPFGCMPEVTAMSALQRISRERTFPILFMSYDVQTSGTGVLTRLEAFCDMLTMRRKEAINA
jgi:predicted nucleotide-binding protein (sugar kinase/HSP70/actin superfamily)